MGCKPLGNYMQQVIYIVSVASHQAESLNKLQAVTLLFKSKIERSYSEDRVYNRHFVSLMMYARIITSRCKQSVLTTLMELH